MFILNFMERRRRPDHHPSAKRARQRPARRQLFWLWGIHFLASVVPIYGF